MFKIPVRAESIDAGSYDDESSLRFVMKGSGSAISEDELTKVVHLRVRAAAMLTIARPVVVDSV